MTVTPLADGNGSISFAGAHYRAGRPWARASIDVAIVGGSVQLSKDGKVIGVHPIHRDRSRELGAFANPKGRTRRSANRYQVLTPDRGPVPVIGVTTL